MALSGTFNHDIGSWWRLRLTWSATQNIGANTSTITTKLYWEVRDGNGNVSASDRSGNSKIDGVSESFTASPSLSVGGSRLINTYTRTVSHDADGTLSTSISGTFDLSGVYLSGTNYGSETVSGNITLNTIPRESSLSSSRSWTAGSDKTMTISRHSTSFRHELEIYVYSSTTRDDTKRVHVQQVLYTTSETSNSTEFSTADKENIFDVLNGRSSAPTYMILQTYRGDEWIGSKYYDDGTVTAPAATDVNVNHSNWDNNVYVDEEVYIPLSRADSEFTHTVRVKLGSYTRTFTGITTSVTWNPTTTEKNSLMAQIPSNAKSLRGTVEVDTFYGAEKVRSTTSEYLTFTIRGTEPTFTGSITYADINTAVVNGKPATTPITGNNQYIISTKSRVRATVPVASKATANGGASMVSYTATLAGKTVTKPYSASADVVFDFNEIEATTNQSLVIRAVDSRGLSSLLTKTVLVIPYDPPGISVSAGRVNGFEDNTILKLQGTLSSVKVGTTMKNALVSAQYRTKATNSTTWGGYTNFVTAGFPQFTATDAEVLLTNVNSYDIEFKVTDKLGTTTLIRTVGSGKPLIMIDDRLGSIGAGDFPDKANIFMMAMQLVFASNKYASQGGGIQLNNSDILGGNSFFFGDQTNSDGEGIHFPHSDWTGGADEVPPQANRDTLRSLDGTLLLNSQPIAFDGMKLLWDGNAWLNSSTELQMPVALKDCPNGYIMVWSNYSSAGTNNNWQFTIVPKRLNSGGGIKQTLTFGEAHGYKYFYVSASGLIRGNTHNDDGDAPRTVALRHVYGF